MDWRLHYLERSGTYDLPRSAARAAPLSPPGPSRRWRPGGARQCALPPRDGADHTRPRCPFGYRAMHNPAPARDGGGREDGMAETLRVSRVDACLERILAWAGTGLRVAAPLGLGKPNVLLNALYRRAVAEPGVILHLYTALSLTRPAAESDLERRFLGPFLERHFGADYPDLEYVEARRAGRLPANVRISEFYFQSVAMLGNEDAQREYVSLNYTHAARDLAEMGINVIVQLVARRRGARRRHPTDRHRCPVRCPGACAAVAAPAQRGLPRGAGCARGDASPDGPYRGPRSVGTGTLRCQ